MSHPVLWPKKIWFYPIGNTTPVDLAQDIPLGESADVLLLGCGDPRSILYTISTGSSERHPSLDFTCCDYEPAVLARNALLFTLIVDGHPTDKIWNVFYHFKIDQASLSLLINQSKMLVRMSEDLGTWSASPYSRFLRVCTKNTLCQLRRCWQRYAECETALKGRQATLAATFSREHQTRFANTDIHNSPSRSAGLFWMNARRALSSNFKHYWATGTINANSSSARIMNPTFVYSLTGEGCEVHYGTYPLQSFHLASAASSVPPGQKDWGIEELITCATQQFGDWCRSFSTAVSEQSPGKIIIRLFAGDAIQFCQTLHHYAVTTSISASLYLSPWSCAKLILDGGDYGPEQTVPTTFDVIDTSNIMDHIGLLNVLIIATPLLSHSPFSTLYTEALLLQGNDAEKSFVQQICTSISAMSLIIGIAPLAYLAEYTTHSNTHEIQMAVGGQHHERVAWRTPYLGDSVANERCDVTISPSWNPLQLAKLLFDVYYHMFIDEDSVNLFKTPNNRKSIIHYHRDTFSAFLRLAKSKTSTDWTAVMENIFDMLHTDRRLILGTNAYQELCCQLHIQNVYSVEIFQPGQELPIDRSSGKFRGWLNVPPLVCLVLIIPRKRIKVLEEMSSDRIGSPMLECHVRGSNFDNNFSCVQFSFGRFSTRGSGSDARGTIEEDTAGWSGTSSLVTSVWVSSHSLVYGDPSSTIISLAVRPTPQASSSLAHKLGMRLEIYAAPLMDDSSVFALRERPRSEAEAFITPLDHSPSPTPSLFHNVTVTLDGLKPICMTRKWENVKISQTDTPIVTQVSPCTMTVALGSEIQNLVYPFPIDGTRSKTRIARKSGWIDLIVPFSELGDSGGYSITRFPLLLSRTGSPTAWSVHKLRLDGLPIIDEQIPSLSQEIKMHLMLSLSDRERRIHDSGAPVSTSSQQIKDALVETKGTIMGIFQHFYEGNASRIMGDNPLIIGLQAPTTDIHTIFFSNHIRLDLTSNTLVADTVVLPLSKERLNMLGKDFANITQNRKMVIIPTSLPEALLWKHLLPVMIERCRTWSHKATCEYRRTGQLPLPAELDGISICGCGEGKDLGPFGDMPAWRALAPYATRAALSPLFSVSYMEAVGGLLRDTMRGLNDAKAPGVKETVTTNLCAQCGTGAGGSTTFSLCGVCKAVRYCGRACQAAHWKTHKKDCKRKT